MVYNLIKLDANYYYNVTSYTSFINNVCMKPLYLCVLYLVVHTKKVYTNQIKISFSTEIQ